MRTSVPVILLLAALATSSCLSLGGDEAPAIRRHSIDLPATAVADVEVQHPPIVVRQFASRGRYELRVLASDRPGRVAYLELDRWVEDPSEALTTVVRESLAASGRFAAVAAATSEMQTDLVLDGFLLACDVVRADDAPWRVRLAVRLEVTERSTGRMVHAATYDAERALPGDSTEGLGAAAGECAAEIVGEALEAWALARAPAR